MLASAKSFYCPAGLAVLAGVELLPELSANRRVMPPIIATPRLVLKQRGAEVLACQSVSDRQQIPIK